MNVKKVQNKSIFRHFDRIERMTRTLEIDLIATGRFTFSHWEDDYKIYIEDSTGTNVRVLVPKFSISAPK